MKRISLLATLGGMLAATCASATTLTFDQINVGNNIVINQDYGDRVTGASDATGSYGTAGGATSNVVVDYLNLGPNETLLWTSGYNDLENVLYVEPDGTSEPIAVRFVADPGYSVVLNSFTIGNYGSAVTLPSIRVEDASSILFSASNFALDATSGAASNFLPNVQGQELTLFVDLFGLGGNSDNVGLDNISFSQVVNNVAAVPLPAGGLLILTGLGGLATLQRRKKRAA